MGERCGGLFFLGIIFPAANDCEVSAVADCFTLCECEGEVMSGIGNLARLCSAICI